MNKKAFKHLPTYWRLIDQPLSIQFFLSGGLIAVSYFVSLFILLYRFQYQSLSTFIAMVTIEFLLFLFFLVILSKLYFSIARPLLHLQQGILNYQNGVFTERVTVTNRSQIGYLESNFNEMAEKIEVLVGDLRKLDEMKTEFLSTVSHELRTPLTSIGGYAKLVLSGDAGPVTQTQKEFLTIVDKNSIRLASLINDILDVEKMELKKVEMKSDPQDLALILRECYDTFLIVAKQKGLQMRYKVPEHFNKILGDRERLVQIFMNLISNAIKYTRAGFVEIEAEQTPLAIIVRVSDSGLGLSVEDQNRLFEKFFRANSSLTFSEGGTGLGLVIVRGLVEAHGGKISVESELEKGTRFIITFPILFSSKNPLLVHQAVAVI